MPPTQSRLDDLRVENERLVLQNTQLRDEIRREADAREQIVSILSHDLKSPLNAIGLAATLIRDSASGDPQRKNCDLIQRSVARMDRMIRDLADAAAIHAGKLRIELESISIRDLLVQVREQHRLEAEKGDVRLVVGRPGDDLRVPGDRNRLLQVLSNLVGTALAMSPAGTAVHVDTDLESDHLTVSVTTEGPGISEEEWQRLFHPSRSAGRAHRRGSGFDLFIARGIVEAHRGKIWADRERPSGAAFHFSLPRS